jgi:RimJ/RimL family protein N-acetyltransferase
MPLPLATERLVIRPYRDDDPAAVWGHGYATEAARAPVDYGFGELRLRRIVALILPDNARSWNVASKCGLIPEGPGRFSGLDLFVYARDAP